MRPAPMPQGVVPARPDTPCRPKNAVSDTVGNRSAVAASVAEMLEANRRSAARTSGRAARTVAGAATTICGSSGRKRLRRFDHLVAASRRQADKRVQPIDGGVEACAQNRNLRLGGRDLGCRALHVEIAREAALELRLDQRQRHLLRLEVLLRSARSAARSCARRNSCARPRPEGRPAPPASRPLRIEEWRRLPRSAPGCGRTDRPPRTHRWSTCAALTV